VGAQQRGDIGEIIQQPGLVMMVTARTHRIIPTMDVRTRAPARRSGAATRAAAGTATRSSSM
jgi:hypothetical protein